MDNFIQITEDSIKTKRTELQRHEVSDALQNVYGNYSLELFFSDLLNGIDERTDRNYYNDNTTTFHVEGKYMNGDNYYDIAESTRELETLLSDWNNIYINRNNPEWDDSDILDIHTIRIKTTF